MWRCVSTASFLALMSEWSISTESARHEPLDVAFADSLVNALSDKNVLAQQEERIAEPLVPGIPIVEEGKAPLLDAFPESTSAPLHSETRPFTRERLDAEAQGNEEVDGFLKGNMNYVVENHPKVEEEGAGSFVQVLEKAGGEVTKAKRKLARALIFVLVVSVAIAAFARFVLPGSWQDFTDIFREETISDVVIRVEDYIEEHATSKWKSAPLVLLIYLFLHSCFYLIQKTAAFAFAFSALELLRQQQTAPSPQPKEETREFAAAQEAPANVNFG